MAARIPKSELKGFYEKLISKGKKEIVVLTSDCPYAQIIVIANVN